MLRLDPSNQSGLMLRLDPSLLLAPLLRPGFQTCPSLLLGRLLPTAPGLLPVPSLRLAPLLRSLRLARPMVQLGLPVPLLR